MTLGFVVVALSAMATPRAQAAPAAGSAAAAQPAIAAAPATPVEPTGEGVFPITVGIEFGLALPGLFSPLGSGFVPLIELGYLLPFWRQRVQLFLDFAYSDPHTIVRGIDDPRLAAGSYRYRVTVEEGQLSFGALVRLNPPGALWNAYGQLGLLRLRFQRSITTGRAQSDDGRFLRNDETASEAGFFAALGAELGVGPGALAAELDIAYGALNHRLTGSSAAGGLTLQLGYHVIF